jgi:hypothetical protein
MLRIVDCPFVYCCYFLARKLFSFKRIHDFHFTEHITISWGSKINIIWDPFFFSLRTFLLLSNNWTILFLYNHGTFWFFSIRFKCERTLLDFLQVNFVRLDKPPVSKTIKIVQGPINRSESFKIMKCFLLHTKVGNLSSYSLWVTILYLYIIISC